MSSPGPPAPTRPGTADAAAAPAFAPSGFFALRTPLLPFDELLQWGERLAAPGAVARGADVEAALAADRALLRDRLRAAVERAEVAEALFVASSDLHASLELWRRDPESERGQRVERALVRYYCRMAGRATPFGLCAGISSGRLGDTTLLRLAARNRYQRRTRLDMDYLCALADALVQDPALRPTLRCFPNSSLCRAGGRLRYVEARLEGRTRSHHLVAVEENEYLAATLDRAADGALPSALAAALVDDEISPADAEAYVAALIDSQLLVPDLEPPVTGPEAAGALADQLERLPDGAGFAASLAEVRQALAAMDAEGLGLPSERYAAAARLLERLPPGTATPHLFQVDLIKPAPGACLGAAIVEEMKRGLAILERMDRLSGDATLHPFCEAFTARYGDREVPLLEVLDEESGIGFLPGGETAPLLRGLELPSGAEENSVPWGSREELMLRWLLEATATGAQEITLQPEELEQLAAPAAPPLPGALAVIATLAAPSEEALAHGDFRLLLHGAYGPSGAHVLGRFCDADDALREGVERHVRAEGALHPDAVFAEIVHLPQGRTGNVLARPLLRDFEIPYLGRSGAPPERRIAAADLRLSVLSGRVRLRSVRLDREVIPRLSSAHNFTSMNLGVYRFLGALQHQGSAGSRAWNWGPLESAPFLPRVVAGRLVLSRARWRVTAAEIRTLTAARGAEAYHVVQSWRTERRLPRWLLLADGDHELPVDLDNALSIASFLHLLAGRDAALLLELFPDPGELSTTGPEGRFVHELVVPFVRTPESNSKCNSESMGSSSSSSSTPDPPTRRSFPPGSEWLYLKLYGGPAGADRVLGETVGPLAQEIVASGAADGWFFIRYRDPDPHLRLRFHGEPAPLQGEVLPLLTAAVAPLLAEGSLRRVQLDTYEREVERYGGGEGIELAEQIFHADSEAVLAILAAVERGDEGLEERWRLALRGMDALLGDLGLDPDDRRGVIRRARESFAAEAQEDGPLRGQLGERFRKERRELEALLDPSRDADSALSPGFAILRARSAAIAPFAAELRSREAAGRLTIPLAEIATSLLHLHANRLLRSAQRAQEFVLYDFLARLYDSQAARR
jgi:thiopeptide-type bacteriocin biosynthesis protein